MFFLKELPSQEMVRGYVDQINGVDSESVANALLMMRQASVLVRKLETYFSAHQLSQLRFLVLMVIDREIEQQSLTAVEIIKRLDVSKPVMTRTLQRLMKDDLITSSLDKDDGRAKRISLTQKGRDLLTEMLPGYFYKISEYMSTIDGARFFAPVPDKNV